MGFNEFVDAWRYMGRTGTETEIKNSFDSVDVDGSGLVEFTEFAFALMGEKALNFSPLADLELLSQLLDSTAGVLAGLKGSIADSSSTMQARAKQNAELRVRMKGMKGEMNSQLGKVMNKMMGIMGADPMDVLTDEEVDRLLTQTFQKFDKDGSGQLERPEFHQAWEFLGLEGSVDQMNRAFDGGDVDRSGIVDRREFCEAIRGNRLAELKKF
jgi:Ca2+-binding EF-hand superfamily protein